MFHRILLITEREICYILLDSLFVLITGNCYKLFRNEQLTWNEARLKCASEGAHLATARTSKELDQIRSKLQIV